MSASGALPFTGAASDLLALAAGGLLAVGVLVARATRSATAATKGGDEPVVPPRRPDSAR